MTKLLSSRFCVVLLFLLLILLCYVTMKSPVVPQRPSPLRDRWWQWCHWSNPTWNRKAYWNVQVLRYRKVSRRRGRNDGFSLQLYWPTGISPIGNSGCFPRESQLRQSGATKPSLHAECFSVSIISRTLTWTTGSLTCAQMWMHTIAHGDVRTPQESLHWKLSLRQKSLAAPGNPTYVSGVPVRLRTNWATSLPKISVQTWKKFFECLGIQVAVVCFDGDWNVLNNAFPVPVDACPLRPGRRHALLEWLNCSHYNGPVASLTFKIYNLYQRTGKSYINDSWIPDAPGKNWLY